MISDHKIPNRKLLAGPYHVYIVRPAVFLGKYIRFRVHVNIMKLGGQSFNGFLSEKHQHPLKLVLLI